MSPLDEIGLLTHKLILRPVVGCKDWLGRIEGHLIVLLGENLFLPVERIEFSLLVLDTIAVYRGTVLRQRVAPVMPPI